MKTRYCPTLYRGSLWVCGSLCLCACHVSLCVSLRVCVFAGFCVSVCLCLRAMRLCACLCVSVCLCVTHGSLCVFCGSLCHTCFSLCVCISVCTSALLPASKRHATVSGIVLYSRNEITTKHQSPHLQMYCTSNAPLGAETWVPLSAISGA
jgi:hypothetical protein